MDVKKQTVIIEVIVVFSIFGLALFVPAGSVDWPAGWLFLALFLAYSCSLFAWLYSHNLGLLQERMRMGTSDQQGWDKILFPLLNLLLLLWLIFDALDARRFHWSFVAVWIQGFGAALLLFSFYLLFLTFRANSYLSPVVRLQADRSHSVVASGPYHFVRHPMYSAIIVFMIGASLLLGSAYGVLWVLPVGALLSRRAAGEEQLLSEELRGYADYRQSVKYRMIPYLW